MPSNNHDLSRYPCVRFMQVYERPVARVAAVAAHLPDRVVNNEEIARMVDASPAIKKRLASFIYRATGNRERRYAPPGTSPSDLAALATQRVLDLAGLNADQVDTLIFASTDMDTIEPATANILQKKLGITMVNSFDVTNACNSFLQAMNVANSLIATGATRRVLIASGEIGSYWNNRKIESLEDLDIKMGGLTLGDAGAAMVMEPSDGASGITEINLMSLGEHWELCHVPENTEWRRHNNGGIHGWFYLKMSELAVVARDWTARYFQDYTAYRRDVLGERDILDNLPHVIPHQISRRFIETIARSISARSLERILITADQLGNTASTAIPVALSILLGEGRSRLGSKEDVLLYGAASGFSLGHIRIRL